MDLVSETEEGKRSPFFQGIRWAVSEARRAWLSLLGEPSTTRFVSVKWNKRRSRACLEATFFLRFRGTSAGIEQLYILASCTHWAAAMWRIKEARLDGDRLAYVSLGYLGLPRQPAFGIGELPGLCWRGKDAAMKSVELFAGAGGLALGNF